MSDDAEICLCFHVSRRKVANWIRVEKPTRAAQLSECFGAGTGCGWCRPYLEKMFADSQKKGDASSELPDPETYEKLRKAYLRAGKTRSDGGSLPAD